jgi:hypothetical protein
MARVAQLAQRDSDLDASPVVIQEVIPTSSYENNPSYALSYTGSELTQIDMTISGIAYRKTLTWVGGVVTVITAWSVV